MSAVTTDRVNVLLPTTPGVVGVKVSVSFAASAVETDIDIESEEDSDTNSDNTNDKALEGHKSLFNGNKRVHKCRVRSKEFASGQALGGHIKVHNPQYKDCDSDNDDRSSW